jgi:hypothetical protein
LLQAKAGRCRYRRQTLFEPKTNVGRPCYSFTQNLAREVGKTRPATGAAAIDGEK